jgi:hypothetical protein
LVHTAIDSFKLVTIPGAATPLVSSLLIATSLLVPMVALAFPRRLFAAGNQAERVAAGREMR